MLYRKLHSYLLKWKEKPDRKPLIIRGARQVGKSTLVREFGKEFSFFIDLNLEKQKDKVLFDNLEDTKDIIEAIFLRAGVPLSKSPTLIFLDEIQESAKAISQLRYIYEEYPQLYIIAAGSLLEFSLNQVASFPVGRVEQVVLHPFDFDEFLLASGKEDILNELKTVPVNKYAHDILIDLFNDYAIIGGMPEVIKKYVEEKSMTNLGEIYTSLWQSYRDDIEKYGSNSTERKILRHIIDTAPSERDRVVLARFGNSSYRSREMGEAMRALDMARIIQLIYPTTNVHPPAIPDMKRRPRLQFIDTGLLNFTLGCQYEMIGIKDLNDFSRGRIIQHITAQQLQAQNHSPLYRPLFWVREKSNSNAEVDIVYQHNKYHIPIEVKSGEQGTLRSLHQFIERCDHKYAIRLLANHFLVEKTKTPAGVPYFLMNLPYYVSTKIAEYVEWFVSNY
jgi:predicted AAA+ superfamily ATPase